MALPAEVNYSVPAVADPMDTLGFKHNMYNNETAHGNANDSPLTFRSCSHLKSLRCTGSQTCNIITRDPRNTVSISKT
eukprot:5501941-Lingulodinium_polyedra.AAC.1